MEPTDRRMSGVVAALARGVLGDGYVPEVTARMLAGISQLASSTERSRLERVLRALDTRAGALLLTGFPFRGCHRTRPSVWW
jgi:hypothetical protein